MNIRERPMRSRLTRATVLLAILVVFLLWWTRQDPPTAEFEAPTATRVHTTGAPGEALAGQQDDADEEDSDEVVLLTLRVGYSKPFSHAPHVGFVVPEELWPVDAPLPDIESTHRAQRLMDRQGNRLNPPEGGYEALRAQFVQAAEADGILDISATDEPWTALLGLHALRTRAWVNYSEASDAFITRNRQGEEASHETWGRAMDTPELRAQVPLKQGTPVREAAAEIEARWPDSPVATLARTYAFATLIESRFDTYDAQAAMDMGGHWLLEEEDPVVLDQLLKGIGNLERDVDMPTEVLTRIESLSEHHGDPIITSHFLAGWYLAHDRPEKAETWIDTAASLGQARCDAFRELRTSTVEGLEEQISICTRMYEDPVEATRDALAPVSTWQQAVLARARRCHEETPITQSTWDTHATWSDHWTWEDPPAGGFAVCLAEGVPGPTPPNGQRIRLWIRNAVR